MRIHDLEKQLGELARHSAACTTLLSIPGVGVLAATAMVAATSGEVSHFQDARHFAAWFGLTPKENSSGTIRKLGLISKREDAYVRMLLTHGAIVASMGARSGETQHATKQSVHSPTNWRGCATQRFAITNPTLPQSSTKLPSAVHET